LTCESGWGKIAKLLLVGSGSTVSIQVDTVGTYKEKNMEWTSPKFEEVCLNCEINSYANAAL
jgi:coenzyme PQQ precursor peptide PqqA